MTDNFRPDAKRNVEEFNRSNECVNTNQLKLVMLLVTTEHLRENRKLVPSNYPGK